MKPIFLDPPFDSVCFYVFFCFGDFLGNGDPFGDVFIIFQGDSRSVFDKYELKWHSSELGER